MDAFDSAVLRWDVTRFLRMHAHEVEFTDTGQVHCDHGSCSGKRLYVNMRTKLWICHKCNSRGNALSLVKLFTGCSDAEAIKTILLATPRGDDTAVTHVEAPEQPAAMHPLYRALMLPETDKSRPYWDYVLERGLSISTVQKYKLGYIRTGEERKRLVIPIYQGGELAGYTARSLRNIKMKYWVPPWCHTSKLLFNIDEVVGKEECVLVEGQFDAFRLPDRMVCTFGKKISQEQVRLLVQAGVKKITLCYDGDAGKAGVEFAVRLPEFIDVYKATLPPEYDPGNAPTMELLQALKDAKPVDVAVHSAM